MRFIEAGKWHIFPLQLHSLALGEIGSKAPSEDVLHRPRYLYLVETGTEIGYIVHVSQCYWRDLDTRMCYPAEQEDVP